MRQTPAALALAALAVVSLAPAGLRAQPKTDPNRKDRSQPLNLQRGAANTGAFAEAGRKRMSGGDCAGALDAFDEALRHSDDKTLYRDRGLCHERLGQPYPAIDDYQQYLTSTPEPPDADPIRRRLAALADQVHGRAPSTVDEDDNPFGRPTPLSTGAGATEVGAENGTFSGPLGDDENDDLRGTLRRGKGWSVGAFLCGRNWLQANLSLSDRQTWAECVGLELRYSLGARSAIVLDLGYQHFDSTTADSYVLSGFTSLVGYEFRFPLDPSYDNQIVFTPGVGYEHVVYEPSGLAQSTDSVGGASGRLRVGWRHMVGPNTSFDAALEGGVIALFDYDTANPQPPNPDWAGLVGLHVALAWGL